MGAAPGPSTWDIERDYGRSYSGKTRSNSWIKSPDNCARRKAKSAVRPASQTHPGRRTNPRVLSPFFW
ncbi:hypothetical protein KM043_004363 [Ampulex compressa]|nr:hypothetical protein KM043_004363 [Ampulex compressa]